MMRIKLLLVAVIAGVAGAAYLSVSARRAGDQIREDADVRLAAARVNVLPALDRAAAEPLDAAKAAAADPMIGQAFDDQNRPTAAALEMAVTTASKVPAGAKPDLVVLLSHGGAARYRVGKSNRVEKNDVDYRSLGGGTKARALIAVVEGSPYQIAVAPLAAADPSAPPAGLLALGYALGGGYAHKLADAAGVDDALLLDGNRLVASTLLAGTRAQLPATLGAGYFDFGPLLGGRFVILSRLRMRLPLGTQARAAYRAVSVPLGPKTTAILAVRTASALAGLADDQRWLIGLITVIIAACLLFAVSGGDPLRGMSQIAGVADKIAQGDLTLRAPTEKLSPISRRIAVALNAIVAQAAAQRSASTPPKPSIPSVDALLQAAAIPEAAAAPAPAALPPPVAEAAENGGAATLPKPAKDEADFGGLFDDSQAVKPAPLPPAPLAPPEPLAPPLVMAAPVASPPIAAPRADDLEAKDLDAKDAPATAALEPPTRPIRTATKPPSASLPVSSGGPADENHFQAVFREFLATRAKCGEPAEGLPYDKFAQKLLRNQEQLVAKYACKSVRFQVYVKEGKAALKAIPVRE